MAPTRALGNPAKLTQRLTVLALAGVGTAMAGRVRRQRPAMQTVPGKYRIPLFYVVDGPYDRQPPKRDSLAERVINKVAPTGIGRPIELPARDGAPPVKAFVYDPPGRKRPSGALLWIHGGGMIIGGPWMDHTLCTRIAKDLGILVLSVDYRLAPEHPFPAGPEDCYTGLLWLHDEAESRGLDPARIAVAGASAGGGLSAMVAQMAYDRGVGLAFQGLVYPMLDDRTVLRTNDSGRGALVWTREKNEDAWGWFLGHPVTEVEDRPYAAAARRADVSGLAPAWIGVGDKDLFYEEDLAYADRLEQAAVPGELVTVPGMPHAADVAQWIPEMKDFRRSMIEAIGRALA